MHERNYARQKFDVTIERYEWAKNRETVLKYTLPKLASKRNKHNKVQSGCIHYSKPLQKTKNEYN